ncbi:MAG TPA: acetylxylan esterase [Firmicutes bacterium]|nr:acetylxylan esterase [Bacillota bacterium]
MPVFELPLAELKNYQGRNTRPADFDDYWERALAEMRRVDPEVELVPATRIR